MKKSAFVQKFKQAGSLKRVLLGAATIVGLTAISPFANAEGGNSYSGCYQTQCKLVWQTQTSPASCIGSAVSNVQIKCPRKIKARTVVPGADQASCEKVAKTLNQNSCK